LERELEGMAALKAGKEISERGEQRVEKKEN
jgi:hypothetical protein